MHEKRTEQLTPPQPCCCQEQLHNQQIYRTPLAARASQCDAQKECASHNAPLSARTHTPATNPTTVAQNSSTRTEPRQLSLSPVCQEQQQASPSIHEQISNHQTTRQYKATTKPQTSISLDKEHRCQRYEKHKPCNHGKER